MRLLKWTTNFDVYEESPVVPMDQATTTVSHPFLACVMVKMDVSKKHPKEFWIGSELNGYLQKS
ncbi:hypothetical protein IEQ34_000340 [Dendrobium chrysotoxum]|uniref:Uncharacterized protein n=1 Tax=Dendrobium chrysotoxum TaxID=161865 RepID=A0AAV7HQ80_DENCH|nr:hypothetical protein IEQ34_000340 [Dendrobium chrysotoxum]